MTSRIKARKALDAAPAAADVPALAAGEQVSPPAPGRPPKAGRSAKAAKAGKAAKTTGATGGLLQLKIVLRHVEPPVWRRVLVPDGLDFGRMHGVIQLAMGWEDNHLHEFRVGERAIGPDLDPGPFDDVEIEPEDEVLLRDALGRGRKFSYWYDFGDDWWHDIAVEKRLPDDGGGVRLVDGAGACPPEDCGGTWGYAHLKEALADRKHPDHAEMLDWLGGAFDPNHFDLAERAEVLARAFAPAQDP